jgi:hypothetical protein
MDPSWDQNWDGINDCENDWTCDDSVDYTVAKENPTALYTRESRKTMIPETCTSFFDGCNNCTRMENASEAACTKMMCETYQEPKCLD